MTRITSRSLAICVLALAFEPLRAGVCAHAPAGFASRGLAWAQRFADPGFGDPTTLRGATDPSGLPPIHSAVNPYLPQNYGTLPPASPVTPVRPPSWPGGGAQPLPPSGAPIAQGPPGGYRVANAAAATSTRPSKPLSEPPYDPAAIMARVGSERIQGCEVLPMINRAINQSLKQNPEFAKLSPEEQEHHILQYQREYMKQALKELINTKLLIAELRGAADKKALDENEKKIRDWFNGEYLKHLQAEYGATSISDLEDKLRALGGSIESQRALFIEQNLAQGWLGQAVRRQDREPTHAEMLAYYHAHASDWDTPARARWEQLTAQWSNFDSREAALAALARWGDDILVRRVPFAEVAKAHSQDFAADDGGVHDWTSQGSLRSEALDRALFMLPVGALSRIIEDEDGCHIIRVIEREEASRAPFTDVQPEIKKQLHDGGESKRRAEYLDKIRETTPVWTVFDEDAAAPAATGLIDWPQ